jgi:glycosyltransferase involved in cell wall biosynthesis
VEPPHGARGAWRAELGLNDETFVFAFQFDMASTIERKNPQDVVAAFLRAFPRPSSDTMLIIKTMNGDWRPASMAHLRRIVAGRRDIGLIDEYWPEDVNSAFYGDNDCYVSLHRAEGLGIGMARAMAAGKPVIATGYSGNLEFMTGRNSVLVPFKRTEIGSNPVFAAKSIWAEPDVDAAADAIRAVRSDESLRRRLGAQAAQDLSGRTPEALGEWIVANVPSLGGLR